MLRDSGGFSELLTGRAQKVPTERNPPLLRVSPNHDLVLLEIRVKENSQIDQDRSCVYKLDLQESHSVLFFHRILVNLPLHFQ